MNIKKYFVFEDSDTKSEETKNRRILKTLYRGVKIPWFRIVFGAFLAVFNVLVLMTQYENYMAMYQGTLTSLKPLWMYLLASFIQYILIFLYVFTDKAMVELVISVSKKIWKKMMKMPVRDFETGEPGAMLSRITLDATYSARPFEAVLAFLQVVAAILSLSVVVPYSAAFATPWLIAALIGALALAYFTARVLLRSTMYVQNRKAEQTDHYNELLANIRFIKASNSQKKAIDASNVYIEKRYDASLYSAFYQGLLELVNNYSNLTLVICFLAGILAIAGGVIQNIGPVNDIYAFVFAIGAVVIGFMTFPTFFSEAIGGTRKIVSIFGYQEEDVDSGKDISDKSGDIRLDKVSFAYTDRDAVKDLDAVIEAGKTTAIVGINGSGKSTLIKLIDRLYPGKDGEIYLGDVRADEASLKSWRRKFAVVSQKTALFSGTIRDNICYGVDAVSEEKLKEAVRTAGLEGLIAEKGLDYEVGIAGSKLSGGEAQRVAIARALIKDPEYLILDEATANLDSRTEEAISNAVAELMNGRTVIIIAHDYATIEQADNVIVMRDGRVEDSGSREEMIRRNPYMRFMVEN